MRQSSLLVLSLTLIGTLAATLTACGGDDDKKTPAATTDAAAVDTTSAADAGPVDSGSADTAPQDVVAKKLTVLLFTKTAGFRHDSIADATAALPKAAEAKGWTVTATEDSKTFSADGLKGVDVVAFVHTTGDVLDADQQTAFEAWIKAGGGYVGVHAAADTEYDWKFYGGLVGAYFKDHTAADTDGQVQVLDRVHPSTAGLPARWQRKEEWYAFKTNPRGSVHVLATVKDGAMGHDHPHAWCKPYEGGRSWYTAGGHSKAAWADDAFVGHVMGGLAWAGGAVAGDCTATIHDRWKKTKLAGPLKSPTELAVGPDGKVYVLEKAGRLLQWDPTTSQLTEIGKLDVEGSHEDGLLGIALANDFATSGHVYLYHSVKTPKVNRLSRFTIKAGKLDTKTSLTLFDVPVQRDECCHSGGSVAIDANGLVYVSTGDDTNPWKQDGYAPTNEIKGQEHYDAQRTSANSQDLRGKILRIKPTAKGYDIPPGNLFTAKEGRPEIYIMGVRNPFRMVVDAKTGELWWGETGPDAEKDAPDRGPMGYDEINHAKTAGNYGWPYCIGDNKAYEDWDFATKKSKGTYDCAKPTNDSPNNTGVTTLPPARAATVWYPYGDSTSFGAIQAFKGRAAMMATVYHPRGGELDLPAYYDGSVMWMDWMRGWIKEIRFDDKGEVLAIVDVAPKIELLSPVDAAVGPDGAIYLIEYGKGWGDNADAKLVRLEHTK